MPVIDYRPALIRLLDTAPGLTQQEIALRMSISDRTVRRHLSRLDAIGDLVVERDGPAKRYRLREHVRPVEADPGHFTRDEAPALTVAALAARAALAPTTFRAPLEAACRKLRATWVEEVMTFDLERDGEAWSFDPATVPSRFDPAIFSTLVAAIRDRTPLGVDYYASSTRAASTGRRLHPLGILVRGSSWVLVAYCVRSGRVTEFDLPGIRRALPIEDQSFDWPTGFNLRTYARDRFDAVGAGGVHTVRIEVSPEAAPYFYRKRYHPTQRIEEELADGGILASFEVHRLDDVATFVRSWGAEVRVLEPAALARSVQKDAGRTLQLYDTVS